MVVGAVSVAAVALYFGLGMPGMDHGDSRSSMNHPSSTSPPTQVANAASNVQVLDPASFAERTDTKTAVLVNVHVPFEGDIAGTVNSRCSPCRAEAPLLARAEKRYRGKVAFLGVLPSDSPAAGLKFMRAYALTYPSVVDVGTAGVLRECVNRRSRRGSQ